MASSLVLTAQTTVFSESFETDGEVSRYNSNRGGTCNDFFDRVSSTPSCFANSITGVDGTWFFAGEDVDNGTNGGGPGSVTFVNHSISGLSNLQLSFKFGTPRDGYEIDDVILVQYSIDGGSFTNAIVLQGNPINGTNSGPLKVDTDRNPTAAPPTGADVPSSGVMSLYSYSIPGTGSNIVVKVIVDVDGGTEEIAFDLVKLEGTLAVNFPPVLANIEGSSINYTEGDPATQISNSLAVFDSESDNITSATVEISVGFESGEDVLSFTSQFGISGSQTGNTLNLTGNATPAQYQAALRSVTYQNTNVADPSIATRTIRFQVSDGGNSNFQSRNINFTHTLNGPVPLPACESFETDGHGTRYYAYEYANGSDFWQRHNASSGAHPSHGQAIIGADGNWIWIGEDVSTNNPNPAGIGEMLLQPFNAGAGTAFSVEIDVAVSDIAPSSWETSDYLLVQFKMDAGAWTNIGAFYGDASNNLVADANLDGFADPAGTMLTNTLQRFTYNFNTSGTTLQIRVLHKSEGSEEIAFDRICVDGNVSGNVPPVLANIESATLNYVEGSGQQTVSNTITLTDAESDIISAASIKVFQGFDASEDVLSFTPQFGVNGSFTGNTLTLMGTATVAQYQTLLRSVTYQNTDASDPSLQNRTIQYQVFDAGGSNFQTRDINIDASLQAAQNLPYCESFETDGHGVRYAAYQFNDASNNFWERHDASGGAHPSHGQAILGATGSYIWVGEDVNELSNPSPLGIGEMRLNPFNATGLDSFTVSVNLAVSDIAPPSWEAGDYAFIEYKIDAGAWTKVGAFYGDASTNQLMEDADLNGVADPAGAALTNTLTTFTCGFAASGGTLEVRLLHSSDGSEELGFDNFCVTGFSSCNEPDVPTLISSGACNPQTLSVTAGNLNDATNWQWYTGSCGGTSVGSGTSIMVSPNSSTTYYVRGEGACVTPGACASITVGPDGVAPNPVCQNITVYLNAAGTATIVAADVDGGSTDNCGVDSLYVDKTVFSCADFGTDTVTLTVFDAARNFSACNAIVTVEDTISPVISCPGDITTSNDPGQCGAAVTYAVTAADNCGTSGLETEYIVNGDFETGDFTGWMVSNSAGQGAVTVINDGSYIPISFVVGASVLPPISGSYDVISDQGGPSLHLMSQPFIVPPVVSNAIISWDDRIRNFHTVFVDPGQEFKVEILDSAMNPVHEVFSTNPGDSLLQVGPNARSFDITSVLQSLSGQMVCVRFTNDVTQYFQTITLDNISLKMGGIQQLEGIASGGFFPVGVTTNKFVVVDGGGNSDTCSFNVTVNDTEAPVVSCPGDIVVSNNTGQCGAKVCYNMPTSAEPCPPLTPSGYTLVYQNGSTRYYKSSSTMTYLMAKTAAASFGGHLAKITSAALNDSLFAATNGYVWIAGTDEETEGTWKFDNCEVLSYLNFHSGEPNNFGDGEDYLELATTGDWYDYGPTATRYALIEIEGAGVIQTAGLPRGSVFPIGTTTNTFVTTDASGNKDSCTFTVTVNDTTSPTLFTDSMCLGDSLYVGGAWQKVPGVYTDTATAASGCDSLLVTTLYYRPDSICNPDTTVKVLYIVSDSAWTLSNVVSIATSNSYPWPGAANMLPHDSTFVLPAEVGQPYPWTHLYTVMGSEVIKAYSGVTYYRYEFELTEHQALNARFRMYVDDNMQIFINRQEIALEDGMGKENWRTANHDILFNDNGTVDNGYLGGDPFDTYTAVSPDNIFVTGANDIILAIRNRTSKPDLGGFSFRMDLDKAGEAVIVKKDASAGSDINTVPSFDLYPNPVVDQLSLVMENAKGDVAYTVTITDISGKVLGVISQNGKQLQETATIDVSNYAAGVYLVKVDSGTQSVVKRFVKR